MCIVFKSVLGLRGFMHMKVNVKRKLNIYTIDIYKQYLMRQMSKLVK